MKQSETTGGQLASASGVDESKISRWISRVNFPVKLHDLESVCHALGEKYAGQLVMAHLKDACPKEYQHLLTPQALARIKDEPLTTEFDRALRILKEQGEMDVDVRTIIFDLARLLKPKTPPNAVSPDSQKDNDHKLLTMLGSAATPEKPVPVKVVKYPGPSESGKNRP